ncbi:hypothetical protein E2C01_073329 [Portunus trituberculatus]|uniref:Uncharacterized protein n=1 Tax=Portunus trituberculatus TaxID=210409 RepID=A0A5B7I0F3_PORTR|nr:hypothetical protein [Portunus trituberculatus]
MEAVSLAPSQEWGEAWSPHSFLTPASPLQPSPPPVPAITPTLPPLLAVTPPHLFLLLLPIPLLPPSCLPVPPPLESRHLSDSQSKKTN